MLAVRRTLGRLPIACNVHTYQNVTWHFNPEVGKMLMILMYPL